MPCTDKTTSHSSHIFDSLEGKQLWHITAPAGVSLKDLKEIAMDRAMNGEIVLDYKGTSYGFSRMEQSDDGACEVMIPQKNGYKAGRSHAVMFRVSLLIFASRYTNIAEPPSPDSRATATIELQASRPEHGFGSCSLNYAVYHSRTSTAAERPQDALPSVWIWRR